jgi:hypothetical protein
MLVAEISTVSGRPPACTRCTIGTNTGEQAGTRPGWYALERQDGAPDQHFCTDITTLEEVIRAFVGFLHSDPTLPSRYTWRPHTV